MIKLRFIYEVLLKQASVTFPDCLIFMMIKAYISMEIFKNKYLTLTAITHVNVLSLKQNFKEQLKCNISVNYFLKTILSNASNNQLSGGMRQAGSNGELDSSSLLD